MILIQVIQRCSAFDGHYSHQAILIKSGSFNVPALQPADCWIR